MPTVRQQIAQRAYQAVAGRTDAVIGSSWAAKYKTVCKTFPALIHSAGLCQALAFAEAKATRGTGSKNGGPAAAEGDNNNSSSNGYDSSSNGNDSSSNGNNSNTQNGQSDRARKEMDWYLDDLAQVMQMSRNQLVTQSRELDVVLYQQLSRRALAAASWMKRYAEALITAEEDEGGQP